MELEVDGVNNRVAGRDYYQIQNTQGRFLTKDERKELNIRVQALADSFGEPPWETWRSIHRAIGVDSVDQLHIEHRDQAIFILDLLDERCQLRRRLNDSEILEKQPVNEDDVLKQKNVRISIMRWVSDYPKYAFLMFSLGMVAGGALLFWA